ncbi:MAG: very short patch repair endonuclease [Actinomycetota bacterium]
MDPNDEPSSSSFRELVSASIHSSSAARGASKKQGTRIENLLRAELSKRGLRYRINVRELPGCPDIVFTRHGCVIFCDGDFWHGRDLAKRREKLASGHNSEYWINKISNNVRRDVSVTQDLRKKGWIVLRFWERDIKEDVVAVADQIQLKPESTDGPCIIVE